MSLRVLRGPLLSNESEAILTHYNRLTQAAIPMQEYLRWVEGGPDGPAWHAILENDAAEIVGHSALIPLRASYRGRRLVVGKAEYAFILDEYRTANIHGFENSGRPRNTIMIQQLFRSCEQEFDPIVISTLSESRRSLSSRSRTNIYFPVTECLFILRPWQAAQATPNLRSSQRAAFWLAGICQKAGWLAGGWMCGHAGIQATAIDSHPSLEDLQPELALFKDSESCRWRYPSSQYAKVTFADTNERVIVKKGSAERFLRVCQWQLRDGQPSLSLLAKLAEMATAQKAMGVRWAVYGNASQHRTMVNRLRMAGFVCAGRSRTLIVHSQQKDLFCPDNWALTDSLFSFDP
jgi:hypothetical protein